MTPTTFGVDYAFGRLSASALHAAGISFVCRYLGPDPAKNLTAGEVEQLHGAGIAIVLVWEGGGTRALAGREAGRVDARAARAQADALGAPSDQPIYFAVDFDALGSQMEAVSQYFIGARTEIGRDATGVYGGIHTLQSIQGLHAKYGWQTLAWSNGQVSPAANLYQFSNDRTVAGISVDFDRAEKADYGAWLPPAKVTEDGPRGVARADIAVDLAHGEWTIAHRSSLLGHKVRFGRGDGVGRWEIEPLPAEGEYWCAKVRIKRGRVG